MANETNSFGAGLARWSGAVFAVAAFLVAPALYAIGSSYWRVYVHQIGLAPTAMRLSADEVLLTGFNALFSDFATWVVQHLISEHDIVIALVVIMGLFFTAAYVIAKCRDLLSLLFARIAHWIQTSDRTRSGFRIVGNAYAVAATFVLVLGIPAYVVLVLVLPFAFGEREGKVDGQEARSTLQRKVATQVFQSADRTVVGKDGSERLLVWCVDLGCGVYGREGATFWPWERIDQIIEARSKRVSQ